MSSPPQIFWHLLSKAITWRVLNIWSRNRLIRSSLVWLAIVPVLVAAMSKAESTFEVVGTIPPLEVTLDLPFSWLLLYFAGLFGSLGIAIAAFQCPSIIRAWSSFSSYEDSGRTPRHLTTYAADLVASEEFFSLRWSTLDTQRMLHGVTQSSGAKVCPKDMPMRDGVYGHTYSDGSLECINRDFDDLADNEKALFTAKNVKIWNESGGIAYPERNPESLDVVASI